MRYSFLVVISKECTWEEQQELHITNSVQNGARAAYNKFGAEWGNGEGLQGKSYALPTMEGIDSTKEAVNHFTQCAKAHQELKFYVTPVGCGIAGYTSKEIGPLFRDAAELSNVYLPISFWKVLLGITD